MPRENRGRVCIFGDGNWQREFEDAFEFEETQDQILAIAGREKDLEKAVPMDRLLCETWATAKPKWRCARRSR